MSTAAHMLNFAGERETAYDVLAETQLDMAGLLLGAYELGDMINNSANTVDYLYWKTKVKQDDEVQLLVNKFNKAKETFSECERFGRFHPDFNAAKDAVQAIEGELNQFECVRNYKAAEQSLDELLYSVSKAIADAVSETIKVPGNEASSSCSSGSSCGGSCNGGCG